MEFRVEFVYGNTVPLRTTVTASDEETAILRAGMSIDQDDYDAALIEFVSVEMV
jgi:hypothetical protein